MNKITFFFLFFLSTYNVFSQEQKESSMIYSDVDFVTQWYRHIFPLSEAEAATVSARGLAYIDIAFYECAAITSPSHVSMSGQLTDFSLDKELIAKRTEGEYFAPAAINIAMMKVSTELFRSVFSPTLRRVVAHYRTNDLEFRAATSVKSYNNSIEIGTKIANEIIKWAKKDSGHEAIIQSEDIFYQNITNCDSCWTYNERSLKSGGPITSDWGKNRLFVKENVKISISPKISFSKDKNSLFYKQALEVYEKGKISANSFGTFTDKEKLADFWNDASNLDDAFTPATHSHSILVQCFEKNLKLGLPQIAEIFAKLGIGLSDAFVISWKEKQEHFLLRPDAYIKKHIDKDWHPFIITPQFPEFPSGHTSQIGAFETIMTDFFGEKFSFSDNRAYRGDRTFSSFHEVAEQVIDARVYGGMHFRFSAEQGRDLGNKVAENILNLTFSNKEK